MTTNTQNELLFPRRGKVKWYNREAGYGFIIPADGSGDLFIHASTVRGSNIQTLEAGEPVDYEVGTFNGRVCVRAVRVHRTSSGVKDMLTKFQRANMTRREAIEIYLREDPETVLDFLVEIVFGTMATHEIAVDEFVRAIVDYHTTLTTPESN